MRPHVVQLLQVPDARRGHQGTWMDETQQHDTSYNQVVGAQRLETGPRWVCEPFLHSEEFSVSTKSLQVAHYRLLVLMGYKCVKAIVFIDDWGSGWRRFRCDGAPAAVSFRRSSYAYKGRSARVVCMCRGGGTSGTRGSLVACCGWSGNISFMYQWPSYIE